MASFSLQVGELDDTGTLQNLQATISNRDVLAESEDETRLSWEEDFDEFSEDEEDYELEFQPNSQQLLNFVDIVNKDIQKYFGKGKFLDDVTDDKLRMNKKSGRELYYADLLRIARNGDVTDTDDNETNGTCNGIIHKINWKKNDNNGISSPLGPFGELFMTNEITLPLPEQKLKKSQQKIEAIDKATLPWKKRKLPQSFFKEPAIRQAASSGVEHRSDSSKTLDFSDLLAHWIGADSPEDQSSRASSSSADDISLQSL